MAKKDRICPKCGQLMWPGSKQCRQCYLAQGQAAWNLRPKVCVDCGKATKGFSERCNPCAVKDYWSRDPDHYKAARKYCFDCGKAISRRSTRCRSCASKLHPPPQTALRDLRIQLELIQSQARSLQMVAQCLAVLLQQRLAFAGMETDTDEGPFWEDLRQRSLPPQPSVAEAIDGPATIPPDLPPKRSFKATLKLTYAGRRFPEPIFDLEYDDLPEP